MVGRPVRDRGSVSYNAAVESAASSDTDPQPAGRLRPTYPSRGATARFDTADRRVVIGDGAAWIWNLAAEQFPAPSRSLTSTTPSSTCATLPRPSTAPGPTWPTGGSGGQGPECRTRRRPAVRRRRRAAHPCRDQRPRRESAFTTCSGTATGCAIRSSAPGACASRRASSRPDASRSATGSGAPACAGPSPGPTPSSPCAAASSTDASRTSGSDEPQIPPDAHLTMMSCTPGTPVAAVLSRVVRCSVLGVVNLILCKRLCAPSAPLGIPRRGSDRHDRASRVR